MRIGKKTEKARNLAGTEFVKPWKNKNRRIVKSGQHQTMFCFFHIMPSAFLLNGEKAGRADEPNRSHPETVNIF